MGVVNQQLNQLLQKPVDRAGFLKIVGIAILAVFGFGRLLHMLGSQSSKSHDSSLAGYGRPPFGG